ncbi:MAG: AsmA family protein [Acidobacteria bacterium]|nr:MAG: AsmA family protein [Acidobacteriota bacterium]
MKKRQIWIGIIILVLIPILVPLITLPHANAEILRSLETSLGRKITADGVHFQLFPLPGVELDNVQLADDPAYGLEDMVMAGSATANISLWNLMRGRLVFSHIHLQSPSINLVRNPAGRWNIAALLESTGRPRTGPSPRPSVRFPYLDWSDARVNFKFDQTKTHFYLDQVKGSLARESSDWRLHLSFVPARSDLNLSNTGVVTLDGRWQTRGASLMQAPFDVVLHLRDSYLAGSSALLVGHDAGVHGILSAVLHLAGTGRQFSISGTVTAQGLRRWDLLPTSAAITAAVAARYTPSQDRLTIEHIGDPGWQHVQLSGSVQHVFSGRRTDLSLQLHKLPAGALLPVMLALKANLPSNLALTGTVDGAAHLTWVADEAVPEGHARITSGGLKFADSAASLALPAAVLLWNGHQLTVPVTHATFERQGAGAAHLRLSGKLDPRGFSFTLSTPSLDATGTAALTHLLGLPSPWPQRLSGVARLDLRLAAAWPQFREVAWSGEANFVRAGLQLPGTSGLELQPLALRLGAGGPQQARFGLASQPVHGSITWESGGGMRFSLTGRNLQDHAVWSLLHFSRGDLVQRVFGTVLGGDAATPAWLSQLHASGSVRFQQLDWNGIAADVQLQVAASPGAWHAPELKIHLAQGLFAGHGRLLRGNFEITGAVPSREPVRLAPLLEKTPYAGVLSGVLSGSLALTRPMFGGNLQHLEAAGSFRIRNGALATSDGAWRFQSCRGEYHLNRGQAALTDVDCAAHGLRFTGSGTAQFDSDGALTYTVNLRHGSRALRLVSPTGH